MAGGDGGVLPLRRDRGPAQGDRRRQARHGGGRGRWTGWSAATSGSARPRWPCGPSSRRCRTASRPPCWCPTTLLASQHAQTFAERFAPFPVRVEMLSRFRSPGAAEGRRAGAGRRAASTSSSARTGCCAGRAVQATSACSSSTRSSASASTHKETRQAHASGVDVLTLTRQPDPAHAGDGADGHPRPVDDQHAAGRPPADPDLRRRVRRGGRARGHRRELLREGQVFYVHNRVYDIDRVAREVAGELVPEARVAIAHGQMDEGSLETRDAATSGSGASTCWCARRSSSRASTCPRSTR